jgi:hypothetical protein
MKNLKLWFIIIFIFVGTPLFAQESGDPFFQNIGGLNIYASE